MEHLSIGPATGRINLRNKIGINVYEWEPTAMDPDVTHSESPLADYRQPVASREQTAVETMRFHVKAGGPDEAIVLMQNLRRMLREATRYWTTDWQDDADADIVYLAAQGPCETYRRYAVVTGGSVPKDQDPVKHPFKKGLMRGRTLTVEHGPWLDQAPGDSTAVLVSAVEAYDGRNLGTVDSSGVREAAAECYFANKRNEANLTDVYTYSAANGWSANLMDAALPFNILDDVGAAPQAGDFVIFGIDTSLSDSGPFCSLVFDIGTAGSGYTGQWEYYDGVTPWNTWPIGELRDNTDTAEALDTAGINSVHWKQRSDWTTGNLLAVFGGGAPNITGYWVRYLLNTVPAAVVPTQQNRDIYSVVWPYVEVYDDTVVEGDLPALLDTSVYGHSGSNLGTMAENLHANELWVGLRSYDRGDDFTAYVNIADEQNPSGITVTALSVTPPGTNAFASDVTTPTGRYLEFVPSSSVEEILAQIRFGTSISNDFRGEYLAFLRARQVNGTAGDVKFRLSTSIGGAMYTYTPWQFSQTTTGRQVYEFGKIKLPQFSPGTGELLEFYVFVECGTSAAFVLASGEVHLYDLVLIPVDEWAGYFTSTPEPYQLGYSLTALCELRLDPITHPKRFLSYVYLGAVRDQWVPYLNTTAPFLQTRERQRLWFLARKAYDRTVPLEDFQSDPEFSGSVSLSVAQRYISMRGDR